VKTSCGRTWLHLFALAALAMALSAAPARAQYPFFQEGFDGTALDTLKWNTDIATSGVRICYPDWHNDPGSWQWQDVSVEPCGAWVADLPYGTIALANGAASFASAGNTLDFPFVWAGPQSRPSPFPPTGDFAFELRMRYDEPATNYIAYVGAGYAPDTAPGVWATESVFQTGGHFVGLMGAQSPLWTADGAYHLYRVEYAGGSYTLFVDGAQILGPIPGPRANLIWVGYPAMVGDGPGAWNDFTIDSVRVTTPRPAVQSTISDHWYQRIDASMSWPQARSACEAKGGYLATVTSPAENAFVYGSVAALAAPQWSWLGATDRSTEGKWHWVTGEPFAYTNWAGGEPNNCNVENYLMYFTPPDGRAGSWNDLDTGVSASGVPGGCGCGGCPAEWYAMSTICEWGGVCTRTKGRPGAWWTGDLTARDAADANHGTLLGGVTYAAGRVGAAFAFPGDPGSYVRIPNSEALNPTGPFSVELWVKGRLEEQPATDGLFSLVDKSHGFIDGRGWVIQGVKDTSSLCYGPCVPGEVMFGFGAGNDVNSAGDFVIAHTGRNVLDGAWHHLAGVFTGTELRMYLDGELMGSTPHALAPVNNDRDLALGRHADPVGVREFRGFLDEVTVFPRALGEDEVRAVYLTGAAGKCKAQPAACAPAPAGLVSWWPGEGNGQDLMAVNDGTPTGTTTFAAGQVGRSMAFPATYDGVLVPDSPSLQLQALTIEAWVKRDRLDVAGPGPSCAEGEIFVYGQLGYGLGMCQDGSLFFTQVGISAAWSSPLVTDTAWHHVAATKAADGTIWFYVDGVATGPYSYNPTFEFGTPVAIGNRGDSIANPASGNPPANFFGLIDEVRIFNRPLTAAEVSSAYRADGKGMCRLVGVAIDAGPGVFPNTVTPFAPGTIPVAILSTPSFTAATVVPATVRFGVRGTEAAPASWALRDVDGDGDVDLLLQFPIRATGIGCRTTSAILTGSNVRGVAIRGTDSIQPVGCR